LQLKWIPPPPPKGVADLVWFSGNQENTCKLKIDKGQQNQITGEWPKNQILIPDWTYFHCPGTTLVENCKLCSPILLIIPSSTANKQQATASMSTSSSSSVKTAGSLRRTSTLTFYWTSFEQVRAQEHRTPMVVLRLVGEVRNNPDLVKAEGLKSLDIHNRGKQVKQDFLLGQDGGLRLGKLLYKKM